MSEGTTEVLDILQGTMQSGAWSSSQFQHEIVPHSFRWHHTFAKLVFQGWCDKNSSTVQILVWNRIWEWQLFAPKQLFMKFYLKGLTLALTSVAQLVGHRPAEQKVTIQFLVRAHAWVVGLVPGWGTCDEATDGCFSFSFSLPPRLSKDKEIKSF